MDWSAPVMVLVMPASVPAIPSGKRSFGTGGRCLLARALAHAVLIAQMSMRAFLAARHGASRPRLSHAFGNAYSIRIAFEAEAVLRRD